MKARFSGFLVFALTLGTTSIAFGQGPASPPPGTPTAGPARIPRADSVQDVGLYGYWTDMTSQGRAGGSLIGKVAVQPETPLWSPVTVFVICNEVPQYASQTDHKGNFLISATSAHGALTVDGDAKRQMETHLEGCTVEASLAGFRSSTIPITVRNLRDDPELGTITLTRDQSIKGTALSDTTAPAPADAMKPFLKARSDLLARNPERAEHDLEKAVELYPAFADAWYQLGKLQRPSSATDAENSFSRALAADAHFIPPYEQLASLAVQSGKWTDVLARATQALQLDPAGTPQLWFYNALANFQLGKLDTAEASANRSLVIDPSHTVPNTEQLLAVILVKKGDYAGAIHHLRNLLTYLPNGPSAALVTQQIAQFEKMVGPQK